MRFALIIGAVLVLLCIGTSEAAAADTAASSKQAALHVSTTGSDQNPGTSDKPLATIAKAQELIRKSGGDQWEPHQASVVIHGGVYYLKEPLVFTPDDTKGYNLVVYAGAPNEGPVVLSGGEEIRDWKAVGDVWQAELPDVKAGKWNFVDLYVRDERRPRARTPREGYYRIEKAGADKRTSFFFNPGDVKAWAKPGEAEVVFLHDWSTSRIRVKSIDEAARRLTFTDPIGPNAPHYAIDGFERQPRYFLEGAREFLDQPGEWHLDTDTGILTYKPLPGEKLESFVAVAPRLPNILSVQGTEIRRVRGPLLFLDLTLAHTGWLPPDHGFAGMQACFYEDRPGKEGKLKRTNTSAAVKVDRAEGCTFKSCQIVHHGGCGVWFERDCQGGGVFECVVEDIGGNGVMLGEIDSRPEKEVTRCSVFSTAVRRCGQRYFGAVGIWLGLVSNCKVENCEVSDLPYTGISVGWKWSTEPTSCEKNTIAKNHIHHCMQVLSDGGGIYTLGRQPGTMISGNLIHDIPTNAGRAESNGMFLDEGSSEFDVVDNTIYNIAKSPIRFHQATKLALGSNRLISAPGVPTFRYNSADPKTMTFGKNEEIVAEKYTLPEGDPARKAGPSALPSRER